MSQANLYISKRCPYCRKLLEILHGRNDLRGMITITCIDEQPFPKYVKTVPVMVVENELWNTDEIFAFLQQTQQGQQQGQQQQGQQPPPQQPGQQQPPPQQPGQQQPPQQQQKDQMKDDGELEGYCENGSCLAFSSLNDGEILSDSPYSTIDGSDNAIKDIKTDGHMGKNEKAQKFDSDYERMMESRKMIDTQAVR
tara:strand:- start:99 stop:686 length:588 start_codon:yes stop_codon:yes gene_type:complete